VNRPRGREGGFTMIELMVSLVLVSLLVAMVFTLFIQMSVAFRTQSQISDLQQGLVAAETVLARDARSAGLFVPDGFRIASDTDFHRPIEVINAADGPDELHVYAADPTKQARVEGMTLDSNEITVDDPDEFAVGDLVVLTDPQIPDPDILPTPPQSYDACVVQIADIAGTTIGLETSAPWGIDKQTHCSLVAIANVEAGADTMMYLFSARGYRIDPARKDLSVIQRSMTAGIEDDWEDLGLGFTDLQVASRWNEPGDVTDADDDGDPETDWYSGDDQDLLSAPSALVPTSAPVELTLSVVVRTHRSQQGVVSDRTPLLTDPTDVDHNSIGDRDAIVLAGVADVDRAEEHRGEHIYRWTTFRLDLRNLGVGR
jgi:prepilin-type N-terminal cleavage/methylation domain-containing protein